MLQVTYSVLAAGGAAYFLLKRRPVDFFTVGYFSSLIYFIPASAGFAYHPKPDEFDPVKLTDSFYVAGLAVVLSVFLFAVLLDVARVGRPLPDEVRYRILDSRYFNSVLLVLAVSALAGMFATTGPYLLSADKHEMMAHLNRWNVLFQTTIPLGFVHFHRATAPIKELSEARSCENPICDQHPQPRRRADDAS